MVSHLNQGCRYGNHVGRDAQPYPSACRFASAKNYGAKELVTDANLNLYDFHARFYDPVVPSWSRIDPLCEDNQWQSPLGYCSANPIGNIDPTGLYTISNVKGDTDYTVIVILRDPDTENEKQKVALENDEKAANGENIPLVKVENLPDLLAALYELEDLFLLNQHVLSENGKNTRAVQNLSIDKKIGIRYGFSIHQVKKPF